MSQGRNSLAQFNGGRGRRPRFLVVYAERLQRQRAVPSAASCAHAAQRAERDQGVRQRFQSMIVQTAGAHLHGEVERRTETRALKLASPCGLPAACEGFHEPVAEIAGTVADHSSARCGDAQYGT